MEDLGLRVKAVVLLEDRLAWTSHIWLFGRTSQHLTMKRQDEGLVRARVPLLLCARLDLSNVFVHLVFWVRILRVLVDGSVSLGNVIRKEIV